MTDDIWNLLLITIPIAIASGIFTDLFLRKYLPSRLDKAHKRNRKQYIDGLFMHISYVDSYHRSIEKYLKSNERYGKDTTLNFEQAVFNEIAHFKHLIQDEINNCPGFTSVSSFLSHSEFVLIIKYMKSSDNLIIVENLENSYSVDLKTKQYHDFYTKLLLEIFGNEIPEKIRKDWTENLQNTGIFYPTYKPPKLEPGDIVYDYHMIRDPLIFNDKILEKRIEEKLNFVVRKINDSEKSDDSEKPDDSEKLDKF